MKILIANFLFIFFICDCCFAQTYYYALSKQKVNGKLNSSVSGGQFITFTKNKCYESDKDGFSVDNGVLEYVGEDANILTYSGKSYYGDTEFRFTKDRIKLNIVSGDNVYVYTRMSPPKGVTTCSLIKEKNSYVPSGNAVYDGGSYISFPSNNNNNINSPNSNYNPSGSNSNSHSHAMNCPSCNNSGRCRYCNGSGSGTSGGLGLQTRDNLKRCTHCGGSGICPVCNGNHR